MNFYLAQHTMEDDEEAAAVMAASGDEAAADHAFEADPHENKPLMAARARMVLLSGTAGTTFAERFRLSNVSPRRSPRTHAHVQTGGQKTTPPHQR
jgi:hypothetical protein